MGEMNMLETGVADGCRPAPQIAHLPARRPIRSRTEGFTLLEILVVLVILGLVAAVVAGPQIFKYLGTAKTEASKVQIQRIAGALDLYRLEVGRYPAEEEGLSALIEEPAGADAWNGPYLKKKETLLDPWGRPFIYAIPGDHGEYDLYTLGTDNAEGGEGEDRDITNW
jgi:general secretion pathway protein G